MRNSYNSQGKSQNAGLITDAIISDIRDRTDIVQLVGDYVRLIPSGRNFKALCPLHQEKTASFYVVPEKQIFHCFGCGKGGSVFTFLMEVDRLAFPEAVRLLARRCGVVIPQFEDPDAEKKNQLFSVLEEASKLFAFQLLDSETGKRARDYIKERDISQETVRLFKIGYAPNSWDFLTKRLGKNSERLNRLEKAGLIKARNTNEKPQTDSSGTGDSSANSGYFDTFRNRLMIPIFDSHGRICGFGGRVIEKGDEPKYLNSPETDVFNKRKMLFNFKEALPSIRKENACIVVEGYIDVISLFQRGLKNVVATLGTAITPEQVHIIARNCENVYFSYDADRAGQNATVRAISLQRDTPLAARIITFADQKDDPDSFIRREGPKSFLERLQSAKDIYSFLIEFRTNGLKKPFEISVKERLIQEFKELLPSVQSPVAKSEMIKNISRLLDMDPFTLESELSKRTKEGGASLSKNEARHPSQALVKRQEWVLKHLLEHPDEFDKTKALLSPVDFSDPRLRNLYEAIRLKQEASGGKIKPAQILDNLEDPELMSRLSELLIALEGKPQEPFKECVFRLIEQRMKLEAEQLAKQIRTADQKGDSGEVSRLQRLQHDIRRKMEYLKQNSFNEGTPK